MVLAKVLCNGQDSQWQVDLAQIAKEPSFYERSLQT